MAGKEAAGVDNIALKSRVSEAKFEATCEADKYNYASFYTLHPKGQDCLICGVYEINLA